MFRLGDVGHWCRLGAGPDGLRKERRELLHLGRDEGAGLPQVTDMSAEGYCQVPDELRWLRCATAPGRLGPAPPLLVRRVAGHELVSTRRGPRTSRRKWGIRANLRAWRPTGAHGRKRVTRERFPSSVRSCVDRPGAVKTGGRTRSERLLPGRGLSSTLPRPANRADGLTCTGLTRSGVPNFFGLPGPTGRRAGWPTQPAHRRGHGRE